MLNKNKLLFLIFLFPLLKGFGQIGIGTTSPHQSSILEISSDDKVVLIPNVALTGSNDVTTIVSPKESLLIYNTSTVTGAHEVTPGYYYFNGAIWEKMGSNVTGAGSSIWENNSSSNLMNISTLSNGSSSRTNEQNVFISDDGNVGIGRGTGADKLMVNGDINTGTSSGTEGALYFGNGNHGAKRKFANVENDVGLFTTAGDVHLSAIGQTMGTLIVKEDGTIQIRNYVSTNFHETNPNTVLTVDGSGVIRKADFPKSNISAVGTKTADYPAVSSDEYILMDATSGNLTTTLLSSPATGQRITIKKIDGSSNTVTIDGNGKNIEGAVSRVISVPYQYYSLVYNGTQWFLVNQ
ncbi:MAG: hypothetical protein ACPGSD_00425 [Flavobacteriales bacterium]